VISPDNTDREEPGGEGVDFRKKLLPGTGMKDALPVFGELGDVVRIGGDDVLEEKGKCHAHGGDYTTPLRGRDEKKAGAETPASSDGVGLSLR